MASDKALASSIGRIIATAEVRGLGLLLILVGGIAILFAAIAYLYPCLRFVEEELLDVILDVTSATNIEITTTNEFPGAAV